MRFEGYYYEAHYYLTWGPLHLANESIGWPIDPLMMIGGSTRAPLAVPQLSHRPSQLASDREVARCWSSLREGVPQPQHLGGAVSFNSKNYLRCSG